MSRGMDPFTFEIIRHKLFRVVDEAVITLELVSGTPTTAEGHDLIVSLYTAEGGLLFAGLGFLHHMTSAAQSVKHILANYSEDPGIFEDDVFLFNDSHSAAMHCPDIYMISPIHWQGKLAGWVANFVHVTDIGGIDPGGFCPSARECYHEGFSSPGIKLIERGKLRKDVLNTILNMVRTPGMMLLDMKSQLAANHVAKQRMHKIYQDYSFEAADAVGRELIEQSEQLMRQRLRELPDGRWEARQYYDLPDLDQLYRIELAATKEGDTLTYDFTGTSKQVPFGINCCYWSTWGGIFGPIFTLLAWDITWNEGVTRPIKLIAPEGTLVNAQKPAPVSLATIGVVQSVYNLSTTINSKILGASEKYKNRGTAVWDGAHQVWTLSGASQTGEYTVMMSTEPFAGAAGARAFKDGVDMGGVIVGLATRWANAELVELNVPLLYLYRRMVPDSGGPGKYRGGMSPEWAISPHDSPTNGFDVVLMPGKGSQCTLSNGIFGGYPGCNTGFIQFRGSNASGFPHDLGSTTGTEEYLQWGLPHIKGGDILYGRLSGGGGYGDPLDREPELVLNDVMQGLVTEGAAREVYGVILDLENWTVDQAATRGLRSAHRKDRLGGREIKVSFDTRASVPRTGLRINEYLQVTGPGPEASIQCTWCGEPICSADANWKDQVVSRKSPPSKAGPLRVDTGKFYLWEFFCPGCATMLDVDVTYQDDRAMYDRVHSWPG